ncbi:hypothetical protein [Ruegeria arenilitoris]|nr:hypothetical protein [Ruegeria arenilitoris]
MIDGYDKPLHAPARYKTMESAARELDEVALDSAIADILGGEKPDAFGSDKQSGSNFTDNRAQEQTASATRRQ